MIDLSKLRPLMDTLASDEDLTVSERLGVLEDWRVQLRLQMFTRILASDELKELTSPMDYAVNTMESLSVPR